VSKGRVEGVAFAPINCIKPILKNIKPANPIPIGRYKSRGIFLSHSTSDEKRASPPYTKSRREILKSQSEDIKGGMF